MLKERIKDTRFTCMDAIVVSVAETTRLFYRISLAELFVNLLRNFSTEIPRTLIPNFQFKKIEKENINHLRTSFSEC